jgi:hypothetical protein
MNSSCFKFFLIILLLLSIQACSAIPLTPSQTVEQFWGAVLASDTETAGRFVTTQSLSELSSMQEEWQDATVKFGEVQISSDQASVETTLDVTQNDQATTTKFSTVLQREASQWRVDWLETKKSLDIAREKRGINKLVDDLEKLGRDVTGQLNDAMKNWEEMQPEIKQDLNDLGEQIQQDVEGAIDRYGPEIQRKLQDLNDSLEEALKELEKAVPQPPQQPQPEPEQQPEGRMI